MTKQSERLSLQRRIQGIIMPIRRRRIKWGRNFPCLCGSEKKYKHCCMAEIDGFTLSDGNANVTELPEDIRKMIDIHRKTWKEKNG